MNSNLIFSNPKELKPRIVVIGVGGAGGNAINNMIASGIDGVEFIAANTDAQALISSSAEKRIQLGATLTEGLGAGAKPEIGQAAAEEAIEDIKAAVDGSHMVFIAAGMGGGTGTGAASVIAKVARGMGILTVAIVTKPFNFEGGKRLRIAEGGIGLLRDNVDTLIVIPNQNLFRIANERTTFAEAFVLADQVLHSGIACITDLIVREGLINLDFADVRAVMSGMGTAMMGTGEASGERRAIEAAELAILNPLLDDLSLQGAQGLLVSISGSRSLTLYEVDEAASRVRKEVDPDANIIIGATFDESLGDKVRVSIVASGLQTASGAVYNPAGKNAPAAVATPKPVLPPAQRVNQAPMPQLQPEPSAFAWAPEQQNDSQREISPEEFAERVAAEQGWQAEPSEFYEDSQPAADPGQQAVWNAPNDVVIELGSPQPQRIAPNWAGQSRDYGNAEETAPVFRPQHTAENARSGRRVAEVEDFAPFAQQAYRSKRGEPLPQPPAALPATERKRGGLFSFLTGRKDDTAKANESPSESQPVQRKAREPNVADGIPAESPRDPWSSDSSEPQRRRLAMPRQRPR